MDARGGRRGRRAIVVAFVTAAGIDDRLREGPGLPPEYTPDWMIAWIDAGLWLCALSALGLLAIGAMTLRRRRASGR